MRDTQRDKERQRESESERHTEGQRETERERERGMAGKVRPRCAVAGAWYGQLQSGYSSFLLFFLTSV